MHLKQPGFTYTACGPFTKNKEIIQTFQETGDANYIYKNELDEACFQHDMAYEDFRYLAKRTASDKVLRDKACNIAKDPKHDVYQRSLAAVVYKFLIKIRRQFTNSLVSGANTHANNKKLAEELPKPIIRNIKKGTAYSGFKDNIWGADLADMQLISKFNKRFRFLLCVINIFSKYAWVIPLKDERSMTLLNAFQKVLD